MSKVKLPAFLYNSPHTWWLTFESIFVTYKIKNHSEKYNHQLASLPLDVMSKLLHVLSYPMEEASYMDPRLDMLKAALMQRYSPTNFECFKTFSLPLMHASQPTLKLMNNVSFLPTCSPHCCPP